MAFLFFDALDTKTFMCKIHGLVKLINEFEIYQKIHQNSLNEKDFIKFKFEEDFNYIIALSENEAYHLMYRLDLNFYNKNKSLFDIGEYRKIRFSYPKTFNPIVPKTTKINIDDNLTFNFKSNSNKSYILLEIFEYEFDLKHKGIFKIQRCWFYSINSNMKFFIDFYFDVENMFKMAKKYKHDYGKYDNQFRGIPLKIF